MLSYNWMPTYAQASNRLFESSTKGTLSFGCFSNKTIRV